LRSFQHRSRSWRIAHKPFKSQWQLPASPTSGGAQVQLRPPRSLTQAEPAGQPPSLVVHSLTSLQTEPSPRKPFLQAQS
jgi:hypothetical protein